MLFIHKRRRNTAITIGLAGLMLLLAALVSPTLAQTFTLERLQVPEQSVTVRHVNGAEERGVFYIDLVGQTDGTTSGPARLQLEGGTYEFEFRKVERIRLGEDGRPNGVELMGQGGMTADDAAQQLAQLKVIQLENDDDPNVPIFEVIDAGVFEGTVLDAVSTVTFGEQ